MADDRMVSHRLGDYDFELPPELVAQKPAPRRDHSRLLVLNRRLGSIEHSRFDRIERCLNRGDLLVVNDTKVVRARLLGSKESGGRVELLVLDPCKPPEDAASKGYTCLVKSSKGVKPGSTVLFKDGIRAEVIARAEDGKVRTRFNSEDLLDILDRMGEVPLPPYIERRPGSPSIDDLSCYQTEYARKPGAVAAPTAGLHFSADVLGRLEAAGVETAAVTLHVGYGTFAPVRCEDIREHRIHSEYFELSAQTAEAVAKAKAEGRRIVAVGTTVVRTLEWVMAKKGKIAPFSGQCTHYIYPGRRFEVVDCMITNFHLPRSSLILLVCAFAGRRTILDAYSEAVRENYRFFSYGDAMLIL